MISIIAGLFFALAGCTPKEKPDDTKGTPAPGGTPAAETPDIKEKSYVIYNLLRASVVVESGDASIQLESSECVAVPESLLAKSKVTVKWGAETDIVLCDGSDNKAEDAQACPAENHKVNVQQNEEGNNEPVFVESNVTGCTSVLGKKAEVADGAEGGACRTAVEDDAATTDVDETVSACDEGLSCNSETSKCETATATE